MKLYAMVEVNDDQELLMNQCHHPGKIEFDKSWWTRCWNLRNDSILDQIVDGNVMLGDYNVMYKIDKFKWSVPSHLSTLTIQPPIASPASTARCGYRNSSSRPPDGLVFDKDDKPMVVPDLASSSTTTSRCGYRNSYPQPPDDLVFDKGAKPMVVPDLASGSASSSATTSKVFGGATVPADVEFPKKNRHGYPHLSLIQPVIIVDILRTYLS
jgi:hypothetical protein